MSYQAEVTTAGDGGKYTTNALRFATKAEAEAYGRDLFMRWTAVNHMRTAESADPVNYRWDAGIRRAVLVPEIIHATIADEHVKA